MRIEKRHIYFILVLLNFLLACKVSVKKEIKLTKYYDDGKVESEGFIINGKQNGLLKLFYNNGKIKEEGNWVDGKQEGAFLFY